MPAKRRRKKKIPQAVLVWVAALLLVGAATLVVLSRMEGTLSEGAREILRKTRTTFGLGLGAAVTLALFASAALPFVPVWLAIGGSLGAFLATGAYAISADALNLPKLGGGGGSSTPAPIDLSGTYGK